MIVYYTEYIAYQIYCNISHSHSESTIDGEFGEQVKGIIQ
jgi:hypothetical protein